MARRCDITGKGVQTGNNVSHAHNKTRRRFLPNVQKVTLFSETIGKVSLKISTDTLRSIEHKGGIEAYLLGAKDGNLAPEGLKVKNRIKKAIFKKTVSA